MPIVVATFLYTITKKIIVDYEEKKTEIPKKTEITFSIEAYIEAYMPVGNYFLFFKVVFL